MAKDKVYEPQRIDDQPLQGESEPLYTTQQTSNNTYGNVEINPQPLPTRKEVITSSLNTKTRKILGEFSFTQSGAIQIGKYENGATGDLRLTPNGLTARNSAGTTTFAIDGTTGNATFLGTIEAGSVISEGTISGGSITIGTGNSVFKVDTSGNMWLGNTSFASAPFRVDNGGNVTASSLTLTNASIGSGSSYTGQVINQAYIGNLSADKITSGTIDASVITVSNLNASNITTGVLSADYISGGTLEIGGNSDALGIISVKNSLSTEISRLNSSGIIIRNTRGLFFEQTTGGNYFDISVNASNQAVFSLPTTNQFFIKNYAGTENLFTVSSGTIYSGKSHQCNGSFTCKSLYLDWDQNEGHIYDIDNLYGYNDMKIYGNGEIYLDPSGSKVKFAQNIDLNEKNLDAGNTLWAYNFNNRSDRRLKTKIKPVGDSLDKITKLNPVSFEWKKHKRPGFGLIAQEAYQQFPELVRKTDDGYLAFDYVALVPFLVKSIQEIYEMLGNTIEKPEPLLEEKIELFKRTAEELAVEAHREDKEQYEIARLEGIKNKEKGHNNVER